MIKGIFCHDLPIYKDIDGNYCSTTLTDSLFLRYFNVVDELVVATRVYKIDKTYKEAHQEKITLPNIKFIEFPNLNTFKGIFTLIPKAKKVLKKEMQKVDLVFIRGGIIATLGVTVARELNKPYLLENAGCAWDGYWNHSLAGKLIAPFMEYRAKIDTRDAAFVIYVTEKWLQNRYPTKGISTYASNVILDTMDDIILNKRQQKNNLNKSDLIVVGTTAAINNKAKGQQYFIEAMSKLKKYNIRYELVGSGDSNYLRSCALKNGVADRVVFKGQMKHQQVLEWIDSLDIYIQPSMQEGLPRALIEAMSRACPAIGSSTGGIPELLPFDAIFKRGNVDSLIKTFKTIIESDLDAKAKVNFNKAKEYELEKLNSRRNVVYEQFKNYIINE